MRRDQIAAALDRLDAEDVAREAGDAPVDPAIVRPVLVRLSDVQPESISWIWPGRLAAGKITLLVGDPGLGKSTIALDIIARVTTGRSWPDGAAPVLRADVLLLSQEDGLADTIRPKLDAQGADVTRVHHLAVLRAGDRERAIQLADAEQIEQAIRETCARVVVIDPLSAYLGSSDSHRDAEVRGLLAPLAAGAERTGAALLCVMHLSKVGQRPAIYRAAGSIAFTAAARIVLAVAADPDRPERRIVAPIKSNLSAPPPALAYQFDDVGRLTWENGPATDVDVDALLAGPPTGRDAAEQTDAEQVLLELLEDTDGWPLEAKHALEAGRARGIHERTLQRTARRMGIRMTRTGFGRGGRWLWHRPSDIDDTPDTNTRQVCDVSSMSPMDEQADIHDSNNIDDTKTPHRARAREQGDGDAVRV